MSAFACFGLLAVGFVALWISDRRHVRNLKRRGRYYSYGRTFVVDGELPEGFVPPSASLDPDAHA